MELYNMTISMDWNKYAWVVLLITSIVIIAACICIGRLKDSSFRVIAVVVVMCGVVWFVPAIYKMFNADADIEDIKRILFFTSFVACGMTVPVMFLVFISPVKGEVENVISEYIESLKRLSQATTSGTSTPEQFYGWRRVLNFLNRCTSEEVPPEVIRDGFHTYRIYLEKHYSGMSLDDALDNSKNRPKTDYNPRYIFDKDLDTKTSCIIQLAVSVLLFFLGYFYLVLGAGPTIGYTLSMPLGLTSGYMFSSFVTIIYYGYVYIGKFLRDKEFSKNVLGKILLLIVGVSVVVPLLLMAGFVLHPLRIYKALKVTFQKGK
jgi:hypothetical protein